MMSDWIVVTAFWGMVLAPCLVAFHASLVEEEHTLGYATSFRRLKAKVISTLRV